MVPQIFFIDTALESKPFSIQLICPEMWHIVAAVDETYRPAIKDIFRCENIFLTKLSINKQKNRYYVLVCDSQRFTID